jgi:hypothetical protein
VRRWVEMLEVEAEAEAEVETKETKETKGAE